LVPSAPIKDLSKLISRLTQTTVLGKQYARIGGVLFSGKASDDLRRFRTNTSALWTGEQQAPANRTGKTFAFLAVLVVFEFDISLGGISTSCGGIG
jgi:hypothetical protein